MSRRIAGFDVIPNRKLDEGVKFDVFLRMEGQDTEIEANVQVMEMFGNGCYGI